MTITGRKKNIKRIYALIFTVYVLLCAVIFTTGFLDARRTVEEYHASQARLVSGLLVENVNVGLDYAVSQVEQVSYAIAGGLAEDPEAIYEQLQEYASRSDMQSIGYVDYFMNVYGEEGDQKDLVNLGYLKLVPGMTDTTVTDPFRSRTTASILITIFVPVYRGEERIGTVYANLPLEELQEFADMDRLNVQADIYLINCQSLNSIVCTDSDRATAGTWNNLALKQAQMEFDSKLDYQFYIAKMQNGTKGDTVRYTMDGVSYTQGYERIEKMKGWYLAVELSDDTISASFNTFRDKLMGYGLFLLLLTVVMCVVIVLLEVLQKKRFEHLSSTDTMTGLFNKKTFTSQVEEYLAGGKNSGILIFVDVDNFKKYNDTYGHLNGDVVLKKFARELQEEFGEYGIVGRYGGDEFVVFLQTGLDQKSVDLAMGRLARRLSSIELDAFGEVPMGFSAGAARCPQDGSSFNKLCGLADDALYRVKKDGKGKFYWYRQIP
jgi:diguanylate cyclase (GGDEF)-like protein